LQSRRDSLSDVRYKERERERERGRRRERAERKGTIFPKRRTRRGTRELDKGISTNNTARRSGFTECSSFYVEHRGGREEEEETVTVGRPSSRGDLIGGKYDGAYKARRGSSSSCFREMNSYLAQRSTDKCQRRGRKQQNVRRIDVFTVGLI